MRGLGSNGILQVPCMEKATYGAEFVAVGICLDQIIDLWTTFHYFGVPVNDKSYMFLDNQSVVDSY